MKTYDKVKVNAGDKVWVLGSTGIHKTTVLEPVVDYIYFNNIKVKHAFSSKAAAKAYQKAKHK